MAKNVFVIGLDDFNLQQLRSVRGAEDYEFFGLIPRGDIVHAAQYSIDELIRGAKQQLAAFPGTVDAIIGHWDFPTSSLRPILRDSVGLPTPSLESILKCEHKYWSRLQQAAVIPEAVPRFCRVDPFTQDPSDIELPYPFWLKPSIAFSSHLGYRVSSRAILEDALPTIRAKIGALAQPFNDLKAYAELPTDSSITDGYLCIAEGLISGRLCTVEGYVFRGQPHCYAIIDSIRNSNRSSFSRYQYPSNLPHRVKRRIGELSEKVVRHIGLDNSPFNIEFFWNQSRDRLSLLEINPRISQSHSPLFQMVSGSSNHEVAIDIALGKRPDFPRQRGKFRHAAKFMPRVFRDGVVTRIPSAEKVRELEERFDGAHIKLDICEGMQLSSLPYQDAYSYEIGTIFLGSDSHHGLLRDYRVLMEELDIQLAWMSEAA